MRRIMFELEKDELKEKELNDDSNREEIQDIMLTNFSSDICELINQLDCDQQFKLKKLIYKMSTNYGHPMLFTSHCPNTLSLQQVTELEQQENIKFPLEFKLYLTCVTSSTYKTHLDWQKMHMSKQNIRMMPTIISDSRSYLQREVADDIDDDKYDAAFDKLVEEQYNTKTFKLRDVGCGYTDLLILDENNFHGQVWHEKFAGDGKFYKRDNSFFDYALCSYSN
jgi:hypothetical protein